MGPQVELPALVVSYNILEKIAVLFHNPETPGGEAKRSMTLSNISHAHTANKLQATVGDFQVIEGTRRQRITRTSLTI